MGEIQMAGKKIAILSLVFAWLVTVPALAVPTPVIEKLDVTCQFRAGQMHTVSITMKWGIFLGTYSYEFAFKNTQGQQFLFYETVTAMGASTFPLPAGTYDLTISVVGRADPNTPTIMPWAGKTLYNNILVPLAVSTNGRGTGCRFSL